MESGGAAMTGCDKIVEEILEEARQAVRTKLDTAEQKAAACH